MSEDQLTLSMFAFSVSPSGVVEGVGFVSPTLSNSISSTTPSFFLEKTKVYDGDRLVGWISPLHEKILQACDCLERKGCMNFSLLDLVVEFQVLFPGDKYLETTLAARLRELCQWKLVQREDDGKGRKGIYIYHGGKR
jgi:hypothetical protein